MFDSVLQYVAVSQLRFTKPELPARKNKSLATAAAKEASSRGRRDMEVLFKWLYDEKGVRNIIKVLVHDEEDPPHSDESIETALNRFEVEILDWRKMDLCPVTIFRSCENLREVHLRWSGNNAILRSWSEADGLVRLKKLKLIQIYQENVRGSSTVHAVRSPSPIQS